MTVTFEGRVSSRSSNSASGPPGERVILELNPQRKEAILQLTGWPLLEPGSLNLEVVESVIDLLPESSAALTEDGSTVEYPDGWKHIPVLRQGYLYYHATAQAKGESIEVLVRRARNPVPGRVELFAARGIRTALGVVDGDTVEVILDNPTELLERWRADWKEERRFYSNAGKSERERWVVSEFLRLRGVEFLPQELVCPEQAHSSDVIFRDAQFQVKEITNPSERRQGEVKEIEQRVARARTPRDLIHPGFSYDTPPLIAGDALVQAEAVKVSQDPRYRPSKATTDLLFYLTRAGATMPAQWTLGESAFASLGWRSISCLVKDQAVVLAASATAPAFLRR